MAKNEFKKKEQTAEVEKVNEDVKTKPKEKKKESLLQKLKKASGSETASILADNEFPIRDYISTGNYLLNCLIAADPYLGVPSGRSIQFAGQKGVGKTFIALEILKNATNKMGYDAVIWDSEFANNDKKGMEARGINSEKVLWCGVETIESMKTQTLNTIEEIDPSDRVFMMVDSLGNLPSKKELEDGYSGSDKKDMTRASALKSYFRSITMPIGYKNIPMAVINHVYASTGSFIPMDVVAGGGGPAYGVSITVLITKAQLKDGDEVVGAVLTCKTDKNRFAKEKKVVKFTIDFEGGLNLYSGLLDYCYGEKLFEPVAPTKDKKTGEITYEPASIPKSGDIRAVKAWKHKDKIVSKKDLTPEFWENVLKNGLADYMRNDFKYQSVAEDLAIEDETETEEGE